MTDFQIYLAITWSLILTSMLVGEYFDRRHWK
jgi:hypothetical protein